jgi:hypothetical protein
MTMRNIIDRSAGRLARAFVLPAAAAALTGAVACSDVLNVELPGRIPSDLLGDPLTAPTLAASVVADFECAYSNYVNSTTILSDQYLGASGNLNAKNWGTKKIQEEDTANEQTGCNFSFGAYTPLQTARFQADSIGGRLRLWTDEESQTPLAPLRARVATFGAYAYTLLGEGFCSMRFNEEPGIKTPAQVLEVAEAKFDTAITLIAAMSAGEAKTELENLAYVGRARVRLDRGDPQGAAADASLVAPGFEFFVTRSVDADTRWNDVFYALAEQGHGSVAPEYRDLTVGGVPDPRVEVAFGPDVGMAELSFDGVTPLYVLVNKDFTRADPMRLASYVEAQLIRAEALGGTEAVDIINARRAELGLPLYTGPTDDASVLALVLDERSRELFAEGGHRLNDLLRYDIPWKVGNDQNGVPYGSTTCLPLPRSERIAAGG